MRQPFKDSRVGASRALTFDVAERPAPGTPVGAGRWPYVAAHPDAWLRPWAGVVLAQDDPRAWTGTIAFSGRPKRSAVRDHLDDLAKRGCPIEAVPVLWDFDGDQVVRWESRHKLVTVAEDVSSWTHKRAAALLAEEQRRKGCASTAMRDQHLQAA